MDEDAAVFCLDVLVGVTLRNRDRVRTCLPLVYGLLRRLVQTAKTPSALAERAIFEVLRLCRRLLPHKEDLADELLDSLRLMFALEPAVADAFLERIVRELGHLVAECGGHVTGAKGWETVCKLLMASARHPDAAAHGFAALRVIVEGAPTDRSVKPGATDENANPDANGNGHHAAASKADDDDGSLDARTSSTPGGHGAPGGHLRPWNIRACVEAVGAFVDAHEGGDERSAQSRRFDLVRDAAATERWCSGNSDGGAMAVAAARLMAWPNHPSAGNSPVEAINALRAETISGRVVGLRLEARRRRYVGGAERGEGRRHPDVATDVARVGRAQRAGDALGRHVLRGADAGARGDGRADASVDPGRRQG